MTGVVVRSREMGSGFNPDFIEGQTGGKAAAVLMATLDKALAKSERLSE